QARAEDLRRQVRRLPGGAVPPELRQTEGVPADARRNARHAGGLRAGTRTARPEARPPRGPRAGNDGRRRASDRLDDVTSPLSGGRKPLSRLSGGLRPRSGTAGLDGRSSTDSLAAAVFSLLSAV